MSTTTYPIPYDMLKKWAEQTPDTVYLRQPVDRVIHEKTWARVHDEVLRLAAGFRSLGLKKVTLLRSWAKIPRNGLSLTLRSGPRA